MNELQITFDSEHSNFKPGEELAGVASWNLEQMPRRAELRLIWFTTGYDIVPEARIIRTILFDKPRQSDKRQFKFRLPEGPYSYIGGLTSLDWGVELVMLPSRQHTLRRFHLSTSGRSVSL